ncbi:hypothetical protein PENSOL_c001G11515 [Penicillium solitum]|uniref:Uncharacterized protein n=1 Tax=Penicillium solitum TaxID=60172 RepID=A0A1V6RRC5_9EURO|nr:uncharacterized protein PENSOL_c001G11515 [Penicillium solitum]OQE04216.1 hypothetical protein PENSOL_c001G11515 [Penicillium solitum]
MASYTTPQATSVPSVQTSNTNTRDPTIFNDMSVYTTSTKTKTIPFSDRFSRKGHLVALAGENEG